MYENKSCGNNSSKMRFKRAAVDYDGLLDIDAGR